MLIVVTEDNDQDKVSCSFCEKKIAEIDEKHDSLIPSPEKLVKSGMVPVPTLDGFVLNIVLINMNLNTILHFKEAGMV